MMAGSAEATLMTRGPRKPITSPTPVPLQLSENRSPFVFVFDAMIASRSEHSPFRITTSAVVSTVMTLWACAVAGMPSQTQGTRQAAKRTSRFTKTPSVCAELRSHQPFEHTPDRGCSRDLGTSYCVAVDLSSLQDRALPLSGKAANIRRGSLQGRSPSRHTVET
jgi:hypothetical protein